MSIRLGSRNPRPFVSGTHVSRRWVGDIRNGVREPLVPQAQPSVNAEGVLLSVSSAGILSGISMCMYLYRTASCVTCVLAEWLSQLAPVLSYSRVQVHI